MGRIDLLPILFTENPAEKMIASAAVPAVCDQIKRIDISSITSCSGRQCEPVAAKKLARRIPRSQLEFDVAFALGPVRQDLAHPDLEHQDLAYLARFAAGFAMRPEQCSRRAADRL
jgi:hypothetical protein